jgi:hypothetical protein
VADQVLGPVCGAQDEELWIAGHDGATEDPLTGEHHRLAADAASQLLPQHGGADLGTDGGQGLLLGLVAQAGLELRLELVEHSTHRWRGWLVRFLRFVHARQPSWPGRFSTTSADPVALAPGY